MNITHADINKKLERLASLREQFENQALATKDKDDCIRFLQMTIRATNLEADIRQRLDEKKKRTTSKTNTFKKDDNINCNPLDGF